MTRHSSQREYFLKLICSTFLFELSKFIRLVRGNRTVRGDQCRKEMDIIGNSILRFLKLGSKTVKTVKTGLLT